jgi:hypothetical protein
VFFFIVGIQKWTHRFLTQLYFASNTTMNQLSLTQPFTLMIAAHLLNSKRVPLDVVRLIFSHLVSFTDYGINMVRAFKWVKMSSSLYRDSKQVLLWEPHNPRESKYVGTVAPVHFSKTCDIPYIRVDKKFPHWPEVYGAFIVADDFTADELANVRLALRRSTWKSTRSFSYVTSSPERLAHNKCLVAFVGAYYRNSKSVVRSLLGRTFQAHEFATSYPYMEMAILGSVFGDDIDSVPVTALQDEGVLSRVWAILSKVDDRMMQHRFVRLVTKHVQNGSLQPCPALERIMGSLFFRLYIGRAAASKGRESAVVPVPAKRARHSSN